MLDNALENNCTGLQEESKICTPNNHIGCTCELDTVRHHSTKVFVFSPGYLPPVLHGAKKSREKGEKWSYGRGFQGSRSTNLES